MQAKPFAHMARYLPGLRICCGNEKDLVGGYSRKALA